LALALCGAFRRQHGIARPDDLDARDLALSGWHFGRIYGLIGISVGLGGFLGAWIGGLLHDWTHGYTALMIFALASFVLAAVLLSSEAGARDQLAVAPLHKLK
jgi:hypothetical protein